MLKRSKIIVDQDPVVLPAVVLVSMALLSMCGAASGCRRAAPAIPAVSAAIADVPCDSKARMNLVAMRAIPGLQHLPAQWFESRSGDLAAALRSGQLDPFEGMETAVLCQHRQLGANGTRESSIVFLGPGASGLFERMATAPHGKRQQWGAVEVLQGDRIWAARQSGALVVATSVGMLKSALSGADTVGSPSGGGLFSLALTDHALTDVLMAGKAFSAAALNGMSRLEVEVATDASQVTARLGTADGKAAERLVNAIQQLLKSLGGSSNVTARMVGTDVAVSATLSRETLDRFISAAAAQAARGHRPPVAMAH